jgi:hypothetical protein
MGWIAAIGAAGTALSASSSIKGGMAAGDQYDYQAKIAKQEAKYQEARGEVDLALHEDAVRALLGKQRVIGGASGTSGSGAIETDTLRKASIDEALIRYGTSMDVWRARSSSQNFQDQSDYFRQAGYISGATTILNTASKWDWKKRSASGAAYPTTSSLYGSSRNLRGNP